MLDQAVLDFGKRLGGTILTQTRVRANVIDVETAFEKVRITLDTSTGSISLAGWRKGFGNYDQAKRTHQLLTGVWSSGRGWACTLVTADNAVYGGLKSTLPRGA